MMGPLGSNWQVVLFLILVVVEGQDRCDSELIPLDSRCSGCPPTYNGKLCASTTRYNDQTKGACGCGSSDPVPADWWTMTQFTAALNCKNLDPANPLLSWCPGGCGGCYELCTTGGTTQGQDTSEGVCHVFKVSNRCGDGYQEYPEWCSNEMSWQECVDDPIQCKQKGSTNKFGYSAHFDLQDYASQISIGEGWDNVEVTFEPVTCDLWDGPSWDCECAATEPLPPATTTTNKTTTTTTTTMTTRSHSTPIPTDCPGGSLSACITGCPTNPVVFAACVESCEERCATTTTMPTTTKAPAGMCCWQDCETFATCLPDDACSDNEKSCYGCSGIWCLGSSLLV